MLPPPAEMVIRAGRGGGVRLGALGLTTGFFFSSGSSSPSDWATDKVGAEREAEESLMQWRPNREERLDDGDDAASVLPTCGVC